MTGWKGAFGIAAESTYGTYAAVNRWYQVEKTSDLKRRFDTQQAFGLSGGRMGSVVTGYIRTTEDAGGSVKCEVVHKTMGILLNQIFGGTVAPVQQGGSIAWLQTHPLADNVGKFFSAQKGAPSTAGVVNPYTYLGCKVVKASFECAQAGLLTVEVEIDAKEGSEAQSLVAPTIVTGLKPRTFREMAVKIGAVGAEASVTGVRSVSVVLDRGQEVDRYHAGSAGKKAEPLMNALPKVTGKLMVENINKADFADRYASGAKFSMIWEFIGPNIASTFDETFRLRLPCIIVTAGEPGPEGPDVIKTDFEFEAFIDDVAGNVLTTCEYMSTDTVL